MRKEVLEAYIYGLEAILKEPEIQQEGFGAATGLPKYHLKGKSEIGLIKTIIKEIDYEGRLGHKIGYTSARDIVDRLYLSFNGHGAYSREEIIQQLLGLLDYAKKIKNSL